MESMSAERSRSLRGLYLFDNAASHVVANPYNRTVLFSLRNSASNSTKCTFSVHAYDAKFKPTLCHTVQQSIGFDGDSIGARVKDTCGVPIIVCIVELSSLETVEQFVVDPVRIILLGCPCRLGIITSAMYSHHTARLND